MTAAKQVTATKQVKDGITSRLEVEVPAEKFQDALGRAYGKNRKLYSVPGFRRGKAPRQVLESYYGKDLFYEDALDAMLMETLDEAAKATDTRVVGMAGDVEVSEIGPDTGVRYSVDVYTAPDVHLPEHYLGRHVEQLKTGVTDEDVEAELEGIRRDNGRWVTVEREAADGDAVVVDYTGRLDGEVFEGGSGKSQRIVLGSGAFVPGFEEQLVGIKADEERTIQVTFPDDYARELAGKPAEFDVTAHEVMEMELPALDDEFAQDVSEFDTLSELREDTRSNLLKQRENGARSDAIQRLFGEVTRESDLQVPPPYVKEEYDRQLNELRYTLHLSGLTLEDFLAQNGYTEETLRQLLAFRAEVAVRSALVAEALVRDMGLWTDEKQKEYLEKVAEGTKTPLEELEKNWSREDLLDRAFQLARVDMFDRLYENADVELVAELTEAEPGEESDSDAPTAEASSEEDQAGPSADEEDKEEES